MFHSEILASLNFNKNKILFWIGEQPYTEMLFWIGEQPYTEMLFWQFSNIIIYFSRLLEKYQTNISVYGYSLIQGTRSRFLLKVRDRFVQ